MNNKSLILTRNEQVPSQEIKNAVEIHIDFLVIWIVCVEHLLDTRVVTTDVRRP